MKQWLSTRPQWLSFLTEYYRYFIMGSGLILFGWILSLSPPAGLSAAGLKAIAIFALCVVLWVTNVIPLMITSLLAIILFPLMGVLDAKLTYSLFGSKAVFFILGAFILASALIRSGLSSRMALWVLKRFGKSPKSLLLSILLLPAFLSFWMSEHAVAAMMFPIVMEIAESLKLRQGESNYGKSLFIAMAWGCIIGGIATFLGGARAPLAVGILSEATGQSIGFVPWLLATLPVVLILLLAAYLLISKLFPAEIEDISSAKLRLAEKLEWMGQPSRREKALGYLMLITIAFWVIKGEELGLANIALAAVIIAFVFKLMKWKEVEEDVNWGIFLMYGGAICLGFAMDKTGAAAWLAQQTLGQLGSSPPLLLVCLALISLVLTEAISNAAVVALLMPVALGLAHSFSIDPKVITMGLTIPAGLAFSLPMATPATAIAISSGFVGIRDTIRGGVILSLFAWLVFSIVMLTYWPLLGFRI